MRKSVEPDQESAGEHGHQSDKAEGCGVFLSIDLAFRPEQPAFHAACNDDGFTCDMTRQ